MLELLQIEPVNFLELLNARWTEAANDVDVFQAAQRIRTGSTPEGHLESFCAFSDMLHWAARDIDMLFNRMLQDRIRVEDRDPWLFGVFLHWLDQEIDSAGTCVKRFLIFQQAGFWPHQSFEEWASEVTGKAKKTWWAWMHNVAVLVSEQGQQVVKMAGLESPAEFIDKVTPGKMTRAAGTIAAGNIQPHQAEALTDEDVTENRMTHALRMTGDQWHQGQIERAKREEEWVNQAGPRQWLDHDESGGTLRLRSVDGNGVVSDALVCRFPAPRTPFVGSLQKAMLDAAEVLLRDSGSGQQLVDEFASAMVGSGVETE